jgi:hypothetical protein
MEGRGKEVTQRQAVGQSATHSDHTRTIREPDFVRAVGVVDAANFVENVGGNFAAIERECEHAGNRAYEVVRFTGRFPLAATATQWNGASSPVSLCRRTW